MRQESGRLLEPRGFFGDENGWTGLATVAMRVPLIFGFAIITDGKQKLGVTK
jgi:hypothetical protein